MGVQQMVAPPPPPAAAAIAAHAHTSANAPHLDTTVTVFWTVLVCECIVHAVKF